MAKFSVVNTPEGEDSFSFNLASLKFHDPTVEKRFKKAYLESYLNLHRFCHVATVCFYTLIAIWDISANNYPFTYMSLWVLGMVAATFFTGLAITYLAPKFYAAIWPYLFIYYVLVTGTGIAVIAIQGKEQYPVYHFVGIIFCLLFCYTLIRLFFVWATIAGNAIIAIYFGSVWFYLSPPINFFVSGLFFTFGINLLCMVVCYSMELASRRDFVLQELLSQAKAKANNVNIRLERMVGERTAQLTRTNRELRETISRERDLVRRLEANEEIMRRNLDSLHQAEEIALLGYFERNWQTGEQHWSEGFQRLLGLEPGKTDYSQEAFLKYVHPDDREWLLDYAAKALDDRRPIDLELRVLRADGSVVTVHGVAENSYDDQGQPLFTRGTLQNISEQKKVQYEREKLESQLRQTQKMEALGTLAGGVAHDLNNVLSAIMGFTELTKELVPTKGKEAENLAHVLTAARRARDLVRQILSFSRRTPLEKQAVDMPLLVREGLNMLRASLPTTIEIRPNLPDQMACIMADPVQIYQVLMNLCGNAGQAMEENGGVLRVSLEEVQVDQDDQVSGLDLSPGRYVLLSVSDTGAGMDQAIQDKIFEPFFTTKDPGQGTGMGLAVVHGIVEDHGGAISVESAPGNGSIFKVYLPAMEARPAQADRPLHAEPPRGSERILVVDDEKHLVELFRKSLSRLGYQVTALEDSQEALDLFRASPQDFDLVITDFTMPKMTGAQLARGMLAIRPDLPLIMTTGYSKHFSAQQAQQMGIRFFAMKPLSLARLAGLVREALDAGREDGSSSTA